MTSLCTEVTARKRTEEALKESEEGFRQLFENMRSGVAVYEAVDNGEDFIFKDFNKAAETSEHIKRNKILDKRVNKIFYGAKDFCVLDVFQRV